MWCLKNAKEQRSSPQEPHWHSPVGMVDVKIVNRRQDAVQFNCNLPISIPTKSATKGKI